MDAEIPVAGVATGVLSGARRARKRRAPPAAAGAPPSNSLAAPLSVSLGRVITDAADANAAASAGSGTPSALRPPFKLDGEAPASGPGHFEDAPPPPPPGAALGLRFTRLGAAGALDAAGSLGGWYAEGGGSPARPSRQLLAPADTLGAGAVPVAGPRSPPRGIALSAGPRSGLADAGGVAGLTRFLNDTATAALANRGPRQFAPPGDMGPGGPEASAAGGGGGGAPAAAPRRGVGRRAPAGAATALSELLGDIAVEAAAAAAADAAFVAAKRAAAAAGGFTLHRTARKLAAVERAGVAAAGRAAAVEAAAAGAPPPPPPPSPGAGWQAPHVHGTAAAARMAAAAAAAAAAGGSPAGAGAARLAALRTALRSELPAKPAAAAALLRHRLRAIDGDADGVVGADDLLRLVAGMREVAALRGDGPPCSAPGGVAPEDVGLLVRRLRGEAPDAVNRVPGVSGEAFVEWVLAAAAADGEGGGAEPAPAPAPEKAPAAAGAAAGAAAAGTAAAAAAVGRPVFDASAAHKMASFRAGWEAKHGAAARKEAALDAAVPPTGPTWTSAAPREWRVLHLAQPAPPAAS
jgi:hypothetical protein